ncbi:MAG: MerR family transcriptional regulator [Polyangiaceae bacterium]
MPKETPDPRTTYTIDELAAVSRTASRTIRFYQSRGVLAKPAIHGRVAHYDASHVERLKLIAQLQDRGLTIDAIQGLVSRIDGGELDVGEWLGLEAQLSAPWADDSPRWVTPEELARLVGVRPEGFFHELVSSGAVSTDDRRGIHLRSPRLFAILLRLHDAGISPKTALEAEAILREHLARAASEVTKLFTRALERRSAARGLGGVGDTVGALKATSRESVTLIFDQEIERALHAYVATGKPAGTRKDPRARRAERARRRERR